MPEDTKNPFSLFHPDPVLRDFSKTLKFFPVKMKGIKRMDAIRNRKETKRKGGMNCMASFTTMNVEPQMNVMSIRIETAKVLKVHQL